MKTLPILANPYWALFGFFCVLRALLLLGLLGLVAPIRALIYLYLLLNL